MGSLKGCSTFVVTCEFIGWFDLAVDAGRNPRDVVRKTKAVGSD